MAKKTDTNGGPYTDPALRERLKADITAGDKGGKPGQWSARKAQLLAHEYEQAGGGYTTDKTHETEAQHHLEQWAEEKWTTADGKPALRGDTTARYLPEDAWERLSPEDRRATERKKRVGSREGHQYVANTPTAKNARKEASAHTDESHDVDDGAAQGVRQTTHDETR